MGVYNVVKCFFRIYTTSFVEQFHNSAKHELINISSHHFIVDHCEEMVRQENEKKSGTKSSPCFAELYNEDVMVLIWIGFLLSDGD